MIGLSKEYIEREYKQAVREYQCAHTDDEKWSARKTMARLEAIASEEFGFQYADTLQTLHQEEKR